WFSRRLVDLLIFPTRRSSDLMLGAGGIRAELDRDFSVRLAPTTLEEARTMIEEVRATQLVAGYRNLPLGDLEALARCIVQFSSLAVLNNPTIEDAEINPLFVQEDGVVAVDGLIRVSEASGECRERLDQPPETPDTATHLK